ncbi:hypothetical protein ABIE12_004138 [Serratia sp. 509]
MSCEYVFLMLLIIGKSAAFDQVICSMNLIDASF